jgi:hypothetical protein
MEVHNWKKEAIRVQWQHSGYNSSGFEFAHKCANMFPSGAALLVLDMLQVVLTSE